jgi:hypothetical protein
MELQTHDLRELAEFFAKRFPRSNDRRLLVDQLRLQHRENETQPPIQAWMSLLEVARERRALTRLGVAAQRLRPYDENLASMTELLERSEGGRGRGNLQMVGMAMAALLAVGSTWAAVQSLSAEDTKKNSDDERASVRVESDLADVPTLEPDPGTTTVAASATAAARVDPLEPPEEVAVALAEPPVQTPARVRPAPTPIEPDPANHDGRCTIPDDGVVGYWYAGEAAPGEAGEVVVVPHSVNVRADYPDRHNSYDSRAAVRCQLASGDRIQLTAEPILVPGDRYWVPLYNGDLIRSDA